MNDLIKTNENIVDIALAHFDEVDELLKEINATDLYFAVSPLSVQYKRLYVIGDLLYNSSIRITSTVPTEFEEQYEVRLRLGTNYQSIDDFSQATNTVFGNYRTFGSKHLNAVPLDVLIISKTVTETTTSISFEITASDDEGCEDCESSTTTYTNANLLTPMSYGNAHYILTINGIEYRGSSLGVSGTSLFDGFIAVYSNNETLVAKMHYFGSDNGDLLLENYSQECLSITMKVDITYPNSTNVIETRQLIDHLSLCAITPEV